MHFKPVLFKVNCNCCKNYPLVDAKMSGKNLRRNRICTVSTHLPQDIYSLQREWTWQKLLMQVILMHSPGTRPVDITPRQNAGRGGRVTLQDSCLESSTSVRAWKHQTNWGTIDKITHQPLPKCYFHERWGETGGTVRGCTKLGHSNTRIPNRGSWAGSGTEERDIGGKSGDTPIREVSS